MTIASEITRLQGAKADARTSIINKGVNVPANASVEDYHTYIDQIQQGDGGILSSGLKLYPHRIDTYGEKGTGSVYSWFAGNKYYGLCPISSYESSSDIYYFGILTFTKVNGSDFVYQHLYNSVYGAFSVSIYNTYFYEKEGDIKCYFVTGNQYSGGAYIWKAYTWNTINNTITLSGSGRSDYTTPGDWGQDLTGWTEVSGGFVQSVGSVRSGNYYDLYLTLN